MYEIFKVPTETLEQIKELGEAKNLPTRDIIKEAVDLLHKKSLPKHTFIISDSNQFLVKAKSEFEKEIKTLLGKEGPYQVVMTCKSELGYSDGLYKLEETDILLPSSKFVTVEKYKEDRFKLVIALIFAITWIMSLVQSGLLLYIAF